MSAYSSASSSYTTTITHPSNNNTTITIIPSDPLANGDTGTIIQSLTFNVVGLLIGGVSLLLAGLQLKRMYLARKGKENGSAQSDVEIV